MVAKTKTHCLRGHELSEGNLLTYNGKRRCKQCQQIRNRVREADRTARMHDGKLIRNLDRLIALKTGGNKYYGRPCKIGHTLRYVNGNNCVTCVNARSDERDRLERQEDAAFRANLGRVAA